MTERGMLLRQACVLWLSWVGWSLSGFIYSGTYSTGPSVFAAGQLKRFAFGRGLTFFHTFTPNLVLLILLIFCVF